MNSRIEALEPSKCELIVYEKNKKVVYFAIKRVFDILCALCGCMALVPVAIVVKVASVISKDFNPIFYTQKRIGLNGKEFKLYKLRTMVPNADAVMKDAKVAGDLVIADGVGSGDFTMDNVTVEGNVVVRGGGINSVKFLNKSKIGGKIILRNPNGRTRIHADRKLDVEVEVNSSVIVDAEVEKVVVNAASTVEVTGKAKTITVNAENVDVFGKGEVEKVQANANNVDVTTKATKVTAAEGTTGVTAGDKNVTAGGTETVKQNAGGGAGGGSSASVTVKDLTFEIKDGTYYSITGKGDFDNEFNNTKYNVTVKGVVNKTGTVKNGADAFKFITELLGSLTETQVQKLVDTLDNKKNVDGEGLFTKENYGDFKDALELAVVLLGENHPNYDALLVALEAAEGNSPADIENATFTKFYQDFKDAGVAAAKTVSLKGLMGEINGIDAEVIDLLTKIWNVGDFITNLLK